MLLKKFSLEKAEVSESDLLNGVFAIIASE